MKQWIILKQSYALKDDTILLGNSWWNIISDVVKSL